MLSNQALDEVLDLSNRCIGDADICDEISAFSGKITSLSLYYTPIDDLSFLSDILYLHDEPDQDLNLDLDLDIRCAEKIKELKKIDISGTGLMTNLSLRSLEHFASLEIIVATELRLDGLTWLKNLVNLRGLNISFSTIIDQDLMNLKNLSELEQLDLTGIKNLNSLNGLQNLNNLTFLYIKGTCINNPGQLEPIIHKRFTRLSVNYSISYNGGLLMK